MGEESAPRRRRYLARDLGRTRAVRPVWEDSMDSSSVGNRVLEISATQPAPAPNAVAGKAPRGGGGQSLSYKFQRLREKLRQAVASGELSGKLPGERALARRFHVNAKTLSKALTDLA